MILRYTSLLPVLFAFASEAQDYLANDPVWSQRSMCAVSAPCIATDSYSYSTAGDSVIIGVTWSKVVREGSVYYSWQSAQPVPADCQGTVPYGTDHYAPQLIRQDGRQLRIWDGNVDHLLYDFDLLLGDALPLSWNNWNEDITVIAVDSVLIGTEMRARYELSNSWAQYVVEGVGSSNGLFEPISNFFDCGYSLECFGLGSVGYYPSEGDVPCSFSVGITDQPRTASLTVAPVPASDRVTLRGAQVRLPYTIYDPWGRAVLHGETRQSETEIDLSALSNGMYSLVIGRSALRVMVMRE